MSDQLETPAPQMLAAVDQLAAIHGWKLAGDVRVVPDAVLNTNLRVETTAGPWFVRLVPRRRPEAGLQLEHAAIAYAAGRGVPAAEPLADADGAAYWLVGAWRAAVYRWVEGASAASVDITPAIAARLGDVHGRATAALAGFTHSALRTGSAWDTASSAETLSRVDDLIRYYPARTPEQAEAQGYLRAQLALVESAEARPLSDFDGLGRRPAHGDMHRRNVLLDRDGSVAAIVDWENVRLLPPAWEVYRALTFGEMLAGELARAYVAAFSRHVDVTPDEWDEAMEMWWQSRLHNVWAFRAVYIEGNRRARRFLAPNAAALERFGDREFRRRLAAVARGASG